MVPIEAEGLIDRVRVRNDDCVRVNLSVHSALMVFVCECQRMGRLFRGNVLVVAARLATDELQVDALDRDHILGNDTAKVERLIAEGKLPPESESN
jgi:hypothetical protein